MAESPNPPEPAPARPPRRRARPAPARPEAAVIPERSAPAGPPTTLEQVSLETLTAEQAQITQGAVAHAQVRDLTMHQGALALVESSGHVRIDQSAVGAVMGEQVELGQGATTFLVLAREVHGDTRPLIDWRGALAIGAGMGLIRLLLGGLRRGRG
ncbi:MAG TPA: hypothetical protein VMH24_05830 [Candidatus Sulfotelmatobacter sp.]|nr:hypothetical protein [Candidatus Sulfotelmatobacter sp.]